MNTIIARVSTAVLLLLIVGSPRPVRAETPGYVQILSATVRDQKIPGATIILQKNGEQSVATTTDAGGRAQVRDSTSSDPAVLLIVRKVGYSDLIAKCPCSGMTYAISPILRRLDAMRIVLNWGQNPLDLDGHLAFGGNHIFFRNKSGPDAQLDVDHTDGFGPETITVTRKHPGQRYVYAVQDYSDRHDPQTANLSLSDAKVFVYVGQTLIRTYYVPRDRLGNLWTVFVVSEAGDLQDINTMSGITAEGPTDLTTELVFGTHPGMQVATTALATAAPLRSAPIRASARKLNTQGETAYRQGDYGRATRLFQAAIEQQADYGQAYSNLGLAFQRSGRVAEALWANRKAIALATGPAAPRTRASTHFNNGRIYENAGQLDDALREYESAVAEKYSPVYENAIRRVQQHGAH
jgi:hypothetical protein